MQQCKMQPAAPSNKPIAPSLFYFWRRACYNQLRLDCIYYTWPDIDYYYLFAPKIIFPVSPDLISKFVKHFDDDVNETATYASFYRLYK